MINLERLSASLYAKTLNLTGTHGGKPEFGTDDWNHLRGRLASKDDLACDVIESLFSEPVALTPDCAARVKLAQLQHAWRLSRAVEIAKLTLHIAQNDAEDLHINRAKAQVIHAENELKTAKAARWPAYSARYGAIRDEVFRELARAVKCRKCAGRRYVQVGELMQPCAVCGGSGRERRTVNARAEALGLSNGVYQRDWERVYEWTLVYCAEARARGLMIMRSEIGIETV